MYACATRASALVPARSASRWMFACSNGLYSRYHAHIATNICADLATVGRARRKRSSVARSKWCARSASGAPTPCSARIAVLWRTSGERLRRNCAELRAELRSAPQLGDARQLVC